MGWALISRSSPQVLRIYELLTHFDAPLAEAAQHDGWWKRAGWSVAKRIRMIAGAPSLT